MTSRVLTTDQEQAWRLASPGTQSVFASLDYATIVEEHSGHEARLFVWCSDEVKVVYPFSVRSVKNLPFSETTTLHGADIKSPEYTGPLTHGEATDETDIAFRKDFAAYCQEAGIVAEFAHLHPWRWRPGLLSVADVALDREIVYVDLTWSEETLWQESFTYACRKNINRGRREGVRVFRATTPDHVREFYRIYIHTMDRRGAQKRYYFPLDYFMAFFEHMPDQASFFLAEYQDQVVAATLYLHDDTDVFSYLGGADHAFQHVRPTNMIVYEAIRWARQQGKKRLILGGGYEPNDGIFRFKASFSPLRAQFFVYRHVHLPEVYDHLCRAWADYYQVDLPIAEVSDFFPAYRAISDIRK